MNSDADDGPGAMYAEYAKTDKLLHRRRGWAWTAGSGCAALVVLILIAGVLEQPTGTGTDTGTGPGHTALGIIAFLLAGLILVSVAVVVIDTIRLRLRSPRVRPRAWRHAIHHPVHAHAYQYPPRHKVSWVFSWAVMLFLFLFGIFTLPGLVDGVAYFAGAGTTVTFMPTSYTRSCGNSNSGTCMTNGILEGSGESAQWPDKVPLGRPFTVREPLWNWGFGNTLIDGTDSAVGEIMAGTMGGAFSVLIAIFAVKLLRRSLWHRRETRKLMMSRWTR
ncbi:MAG: hypothetical protein J2P25_14670 [Nocardiopsaceae bacterium]|nr:hypothetical protein [Nocardiopsaceae bacterium]